jgi:hypothetical protein
LWQSFYTLVPIQFLMATLDIRKVLGPKGSKGGQITLSRSWCDFYSLKPGSGLYMLTDGPFTLVVPSEININKAKEALEELVRKYNGAPRPPPTTVKPEAPRRAPQGDDKQDQENDEVCQQPGAQAQETSPEPPRP